MQDLKQYAPTIAIASVVAALVGAGMSPGVPEPTPAALTEIAAEREPVRIAAPARGGASLVSCGNMRGANGASLRGDAGRGTVKLGEGADGHCTIVREVPGLYTCTVRGARAIALTPTDLAVDHAASTFTYECEAR